MSVNPYSSPVEIAAGKPSDVGPGSTNNRAVIVLLILLPLLFDGYVWGLFSPQAWQADQRAALSERLELAAITASGPLAVKLFFTETDLGLLTAGIGILWVAWILLVITTRLRRFAYRWHFLASCGWCLSGFMMTSLAVT